MATNRPGAEEPQLVQIGVLAKRGADQSLRQWNATAAYLTTHIPNYCFRIRPLTHDQVAPAVSRGQVGFILVNPSLYIQLEQFYGASRIATLKNLRAGQACTVYASVIFYMAGRQDIRRLVDLKGKTMLAVAEDSFGGWQMAWRELKDVGIEPSRDLADLRFGETHDAVVYAVRAGRVDAGVVRTDTLERMAAEGKIKMDEFQVIHEHLGSVHPSFLHSTRIYPEWPFAQVRGTPDELAQQVAIALLKMSPDDPAARAATCAGWTIPQNYQPVRDCLKELRIGPYEDYGKVTFREVLRRYWPWVAAAAISIVLASCVSVYVMRLNRALRGALQRQREELVGRRQAEETLGLSEARLRQIIDLVPHMIFAKDAAGKFLLANRATAQAYNMTVDELTGKSHADVHRVKEEVARMLADDRTVIASGQIKTIPEESFVRADGHARLLRVLKIPYTSSGTSEPAVLGVAIDITELKGAEEALRKSEQLRADSEKLAAIGRLAAGIAHEINNPLTVVLTFAHLLREQEDNDDQTRQDLDLVISETERASEVVRGLLDFARERAPIKELLNINDTIRHTLRLLGKQNAFQHIDVQENLAVELPRVYGDGNQLQQVLLNLCLNACEAMQAGGTLTIGSLVHDDHVLVTVTDTGCGIKKEHRDRIFEPFFSTKPVGKGTGLGLSVSYGIVQEHGGALKFESVEQAGTTFTVTLPIAKREDASNDGKAALT